MTTNNLSKGLLKRLCTQIGVVYTKELEQIVSAYHQSKPQASDDELKLSVVSLKADAERWTQYAKTGFPTAHYNEFDSARKIKGWQIMIKGEMHYADTANEAADMLIEVRGEIP